MSTKLDQKLIVKCPHCYDYIEIIELNCCIFRHGIMKNTGLQMDPHAHKEICDNLFKNSEIHGCGKPFMINEKLEAIICDYK